MDGKPLSTSTSESRRFPNEIFAIIIENLRGDIPSLRKTSLVCKDFVTWSQSPIFRHVILSPLRIGLIPGTSPLTARLSALLRDPQSVSLGRLVQTLDCWCPYGRDKDDGPEFEFIIRNLPSLIRLKMNSGYWSKMRLEAIGKYLGGQLKEFWIDGPDFAADDFSVFQTTLSSSLNVLETMVLSCCTVESPGEWNSGMAGALVLPSSLKMVYLRRVDEYIIGSIEVGMEISRPPMLHTLLLSSRSIAFELSTLWRALGPDTRVVVEIDDGWFYNMDAMELTDEDFREFLVNFIQGMRSPQLTLDCPPFCFRIVYFVHFIPSLPETVRKIYINFEPSADDDLEAHHEDWVKLDGALLKRYKLGLLESVCFRVINRMIWGGCTTISDPDTDRKILDRVRALLPRSEQAGILEDALSNGADEPLLCPAFRTTNIDSTDSFDATLLLGL